MAADALRVLIVEDSELDARLLVRELTAGGFSVDWTRVDGEAAMRTELDSSAWDLVLCDYSLPGFSAPAALRVYAESATDIPLLVVSGTVGEDLAVECMRMGAHDYLMKDRLARLCEAVRRELRDTEVRRRRRQAERELDESMRRMGTLLTNAPGMAYRSPNRPEWPTEFVSAGCLQMTGYSQDELTSPGGVEYADVIHPEDRQGVWAAVQEAVARHGTYELEYRLVHRDGSKRWVWERGGAVAEADDGTAVLEGFILDITDRKQAEIATSERERQFRSLFESIPLPTYIWRMSEGGLKLEACNQAAREYAHCGLDRCIGTRLERVYADMPDVLQDFKQCLETGSSLSRETSVVSQETGEDRQQRSHYAFVAPDAVMVHTEDLTDRAAAQREQVKLERLRAAAELSAGVSHNLNNILGGVVMPAHMILAEEASAKVKELAGFILRAGERARDLAHRLHLSIRGVPEDEMGPVDVAETVREAVDVTRPRWQDEPQAAGIGIEVVADLQEAGRVAGTRSRLHDMVVNLILNAVDAMPEGGVVSIGAATRGDYVELTVADSGVGMEADTADRIFEPFFTTKDEAGTGLGLSTVHNTVEQWGGRIEVASTPGQGTTFTLLLPTWKPEEAPVAPAAAAPARESDRRASVGVVDDYEPVRTMLADLLGEAHEIHGYASPEALLDGYVAGAHDVIVIDLGLPGMAGDEVARRVRQVDPHVSLALVTGWILGTEDPRRQPFDFHMAKPLEDIDEILRVLARAVALKDERAG